MRKGLITLLILLMGGIFLTFAAENKNSNEHKLNVVFVASNIQNGQAIVEGMKDQSVALVYDFDETNLNLINLTLEELSEWKGRKIDNIMFFCHGAPGSILLGANYMVTLKSISQDSNNWKIFSQHLNAKANIDFYGCEIGYGEDGEKLIKAISYLTNASVRASNNATGNIHDADWDLESNTGEAAGAAQINFSQLIKTPIYF